MASSGISQPAIFDCWASDSRSGGFPMEKIEVNIFRKQTCYVAHSNPKFSNQGLTGDHPFSTYLCTREVDPACCVRSAIWFSKSTFSCAEIGGQLCDGRNNREPHFRCWTKIFLSLSHILCTNRCRSARVECSCAFYSSLSHLMITHQNNNY